MERAGTTFGAIRVRLRDDVKVHGFEVMPLQY